MHGNPTWLDAPSFVPHGQMQTPVQPQLQPQMQHHMGPPPPLNLNGSVDEQTSRRQGDGPLVVNGSNGSRIAESSQNEDRPEEHNDEPTAPIDIPIPNRATSSGVRVAGSQIRTLTGQNEQNDSSSSDSSSGSDSNTGSQRRSRSGSSERIFPIDL